MSTPTRRGRRGRRTQRITAAAGFATAGMVALALSGSSAVAATDTPVGEPERFTSMLSSMATPDAVVDGEGNPAPGEPGATGRFDLRINSDEEIVCWDIVLSGVTPPFESPARTATHVHEANAGQPGPPRLAFPDPTDAGDGTMRSTGCMQGPFTTGLSNDDGVDTADGFSLAQIEANPTGFSVDTHTADYLPGTVRGQLQFVPMGGVDTGGGGTAGSGAGLPVGLLLALGAAIGLGGAGFIGHRRLASVSER